MKKYSLRYHRNTHKYLGNFPKESEVAWSNNAQGLAHDDDWYISNDHNLFKYHVETNVSRNAWDKKTGIPCALSNLGYEKFKALASHDGHLYVPMTGDGEPGMIAVFKTSTLRYVDHYVLPTDRGNMGWCAINPRNGHLYCSGSKVSRRHPLYVYRIVFENNNRRFRLDEVDQILLRTPWVLKSMQGGTFSPDGSYGCCTSSMDTSTRAWRVSWMPLWKQSPRGTQRSLTSMCTREASAFSASTSSSTWESRTREEHSDSTGIQAGRSRRSRRE